MAADPTAADAKAPSSWKRPVVDGKPFALRDHRDKLLAAGLTVTRPELQRDAKERKPPPGKPKRMGDKTVYPARRFG